MIAARSTWASTSSATWTAKRHAPPAGLTRCANRRSSSLSRRRSWPGRVARPGDRWRQPRRPEIRSAAPRRPRHRSRATRRAPCATSPSPAARSPRSRRRSIPPTRSKSIDVSGLYVTPGLIDIHTHVFAGTGEKGSYAGDNSVYPDGFTLRAGVTTIADAGCAGWRNFEDFKQRIIDRVEDPRARLSQHRRQRHARRQSSRTSTTWTCSRPPTWRDASRTDRRHQDGALRGPGMDAGRAGGRSGNARGRAGDGRLRRAC